MQLPKLLHIIPSISLSCQPVIQKVFLMLSFLVSDFFKYSDFQEFFSFSSFSPLVRKDFLLLKHFILFWLLCLRVGMNSRELCHLLQSGEELRHLNDLLGGRSLLI